MSADSSPTLPPLDEAERLRIERCVAKNALEVVQERVRQERLRLSGKFPSTCASANMTDGRALRVLAEEIDETLDESDNLRRALGRLTRLMNDSFVDAETTNISEIRSRLREELVQVVSVGFGWLQKIDASEETHIPVGEDVDSEEKRSDHHKRPFTPPPTDVFIENMTWGDFE